MAFFNRRREIFIVIFIGNIVFKTRKWGNKEMKNDHLDKKIFFCKNVEVFLKNKLTIFINNKQRKHKL